MKTGPKDDRQHFEEDIEQLLVAAIQQASSEFDEDEDGVLDLYQVPPQFYFIYLTNYHIQEHYFSEESKENYAISEP